MLGQERATYRKLGVAYRRQAVRSLGTVTPESGPAGQSSESFR